MKPDNNIHVVPSWEPWHIESKDCPCNPKLDEEPKIYPYQKDLYLHNATSEMGH